MDEAELSGFRRWSTYASSFFIIVAAVLGTGILALPVKLVRAGFAPFVATYAVCFFAQAMVLVYLVVLLQKARALLVRDLRAAHTGDGTHELRALDSAAAPADSAAAPELDAADDARAAAAERRRREQEAEEQALAEARLAAGADLHTLGALFLAPLPRAIFDACVMLHFVSILISYALAGAQAYGDILGLERSDGLILPFVGVFALAVLTLSRFMRPVISLVTLAKGAVLVVMVGVTGVVAAAARVDFRSQWAYVGRPLLIGTVALGGGGNVLPVVLARVPNRRRELRRNTVALVAGLLAVWALCVLWAFFILRAVPQHAPPGASCAPADVTTLGRAQACGSIATIPLIGVVRKSFPRFNWIATFVDIFITLSISVSFITMSLATKHVLDGFAAAWGRSHSAAARVCDVSRVLGQQCAHRHNLVRQVLLYTATWLPVALIAQANPKSFLVVMESVTSLVLNLEAGVFICFMIGTAQHKYSDVKIAYPLKPWMYKAHYFVMWYFVSAVVYDLVLLVDKLVEG